MMFLLPSVICTLCTGFFCLAIIKGPPNDNYFIIEGPCLDYFTEKVSQTRKNRKYAQIHFLDWQINFLCCSGICYASGQFYRNCRVSKNRECSMAAVANKTFPILCFCLGITRTFHPPYTPFATIKNLRYCLVCL